MLIWIEGYNFFERIAVEIEKIAAESCARGGGECMEIDKRRNSEDTSYWNFIDAEKASISDLIVQDSPWEIKPIN